MHYINCCIEYFIHLQYYPPVDMYPDMTTFLSRYTPSKSCKVLKYRPKFHEEKAQPDFIGDENKRLRDYQLQVHTCTLH